MAATGTAELAPGDRPDRNEVSTLIALIIALAWIAQSIVVALIVGSILDERDTQLAVDNTARRPLARSFG